MAYWRTCLAIVWVLGVVACTPTPTLAPFPTPPTSTPVPVLTESPFLRPELGSKAQDEAATPEPSDTGWVALAPGVEGRRVWVVTGGGRERLQLARLDPERVRVRVVYEPHHPRRVSEWVQVLSSAVLVANAGYFTPDMQATGLIISDGVPAGRSYDDYAGMLAVDGAGHVTLRWLRTWPYRPDERLIQAVQSFPVLVKPAGGMGFPAGADEGQLARRTVVAQDRAGRLIFVASPHPRFSLHELAVWLTQSDLDLDIALNLDGGASTGLWIAGQDSLIDSLAPLPAVIAIEPTGR